jgi:CheY-like chemotaxis protein
VLIVDDDPEMRHLLRLSLSYGGLRVVGEAANGLEAISMALHSSPDFVMLDVKMPKLDGEKTAYVLRALCPDIRIIAFSWLLESKPEWAHAFLNKSRLSDVFPLLDALTVEFVRG